MKKVVMFILLSAFFLLNVFAVAKNESIEISFCVGDSDILINGDVVTVEKPYVVGEGVTLVPVRVITEAFGAVVEWDDVEKKVTLKYKDSSIMIYIGNDIADINGESIKMLAAPELTDAGFTMVPLRFISENFGAIVKYDEVTKTIYVNKEAEVTVKEGMIFFEEENQRFYIQLPQNYEFSENLSEKDKYVFSENTTLRNKAKNKDIIKIINFVSGVIENPEEFINNERMTQIQLIDDKKITAGSVYSFNHHGIDYYSYDMFVKDGSDRQICVRKLLFNQGDNGVFIISIIKDNLEKCIYEYAEEKLQSITFNSLKIGVPEKFSISGSYFEEDIELRSEAPASITMEFFQKSQDIDAKAFLENKKAKLVKTRNIKFVEVSDITKVVYGKNSGFEFTVKYLSDNSAVKNIVFDYNGYIVFMKIPITYTINEKQAKFVAESFVPEFTVEQISLLSLARIQDESNKKVLTKNLSFTLPESFEVFVSDDKRYLKAFDKENMIIMTLYDETKVIENEDVEYYNEYLDYVPGWGFTRYARLLRAKGGLCNILNETAEKYKQSGWQLKDSGSVMKDDTWYLFDYTILSRWFIPGLKLNEEIYYYYTNINGAERRLYAYKEDVVDQELNAFVFTYTDLANSENAKAIVNEIMNSVEPYNNDENIADTNE